MSSIAFHMLNKEARVSGCERAWIGDVVYRTFLASLNWSRWVSPIVFLEGEHPLRALVPLTYQGYGEGSKWCCRFGSTLFVNSHEIPITVNGYNYNLWEVELNTAIVTGSDPLILCARLHSQCEIHAWVAEENRVWLAEILKEGLASGILRKGFKTENGFREMGWEGVIKLLESRTEGPIVTSYSVCDSFPNPSVAVDAGLWTPPRDDEGEPDYEPWYKLSKKEQWRLAFEGLTKNPTMELRPDNWRSYHYGPSPLNGWQLMNL